MTSMTTPALPPCPTCGAVVERLAGFGEDTTVEPCGHPASTIVGAGGVAGVIILRPRPDTPRVQPGG